MSIVFLDGSVLNCNYIEFSGSMIIADGYHYVNIGEVDHIE